MRDRQLGAVNEVGSRWWRHQLWLELMLSKIDWMMRYRIYILIRIFFSWIFFSFKLVSKQKALLIRNLFRNS